MRAAGLSTIQQTLTPEAANILNQSIAEAGRRNHGQTTPLHVAATLLSSPSGYLRQACIRSHPNSSHPLQCRALELCFSVALERLPTAAAPGTEPPISNALMAALKRAQAHQRRGCPEQQQQPLLAVKVELDQLIISILDDPSVSRVMREASFSSPAVKATIEQSTNNPASRGHNHHRHLAIGNVNLGGIRPRMLPTPVLPLNNRNIYLNPRLQQGETEKLPNHRDDELRKLLDIMMRSKKKNPVLVGDSEPETVVKELLRKFENKELESDGIFKNAQVICLDKGFLSDIPSKIKELGGMIESRIANGGVVVYLGDLKWLVEQQQQAVSDTGWTAVAEMAKLLSRFRRCDDSEGNNTNKLWLVGTATCETYLRCQVYHSNMEADWDLQALPMASRSMFPRFGTERLWSNQLEKLISSNPVVPAPLCLSENIDLAQRSSATFCPQCLENYEKELAKLIAIENSFSEAKRGTTQPSLPRWLQSAKLDTANLEVSDRSNVKTQELQKKWRDTCLHLHPDFHSRGGRPVTPMLSAMNVSNPFTYLAPFQPKLQMIKPLGGALQLNTNQIAISPPGSPVRTDLVLGRNVRQHTPEKGAEDQAKDFLGCISSQPQMKLHDKFADSLDADNYKSLLKSIMEKAWWQGEAASKVASAVTRCRVGGRERRGGGSRGDIWLLFTGPDRVGKRKVASVLSEKICGASQIMVCLGTKRGDQESGWGKTVIDHIAEAVRRNPFSVIMLEDIDEADVLVRGSMKRAMERGCFVNSHGREVSLGNAIFILAGDWSSSNHESPGEGHFGHFIDEERVATVASGNWQLRLVVREKGTKRRPSWLEGEKNSRLLKPRKENWSGLALDLNLGPTYINEDDDDDDRSYNSSDLTVDHEDELGFANPCFSITSVPVDLLGNVDESVVFKPVDSAFVRREIKKTIALKFSMTMGDKLSLEVEDDVLEKILGGLWHDKTSLGEWVEKVVGPGFDRIEARLSDRSNSVVRLVVESDSGRRDGDGDWLPSSIMV